MAQKHVIKFSSIINYFIDDKKLIERGENAVESGDVVSMTYNDTLKLVTGAVHTSMRDRTYKVELNIDVGSILSSTCTCPRGQVTCHHVAALALYAHYNISVTDKLCSWSAPKKKRVTEQVKTVDELYGASKDYRASKNKVSESDIEELQKKLDDCAGVVGFTWLLSPAISKEEDDLLPAIGTIIFSDTFGSIIDKQMFIDDMLQLDSEIIKKVAEVTVGQSINPKWLIFRNLRLTASNFGVILSACRREKYPPSLFKRLTGTYNLEGVKAIQWGKQHEKDAITNFITSTNLTVTPTGLHLHPCGYLGASPDGLVGEDAILEVKCPYKFRNTDLKVALKCDNSYICKYDVDKEEFVLNKEHEYYHQMQGQLHIMEKSLCFLVIWTPNCTIIIDVDKDEEWAHNINILKTFYHDKFIPYLIK